MAVLRFDFAKLQDFQLPPEPVEPVIVPQAEEVAPPPPPPPSYSEADLDVAKRREYQRGHAEGLKDGHAQAHNEDAQRNAHIEQILEGMIREVAGLKHKHDALLRLQSTELTQLVLVIARKIAGDTISAIPQSGIEAMVSQCLGVLMHQAKAVLHVHPTLMGDLEIRTRQKLRQAGIEAELHLSADASLSEGEARLEWRDGMAERSLSELWGKIEQMLSTVNFATLVDATEIQQNQSAIISTKTMNTEGENHE